VDSVWQPAKKRTAAGSKTLIARPDGKIDILQDRHLLNSVLGAIVGFFLHQIAAAVQFCMLELKVYAAGRRDLDRILELDHQLSSLDV
jgi:hypothetical protein